MTSKAPTFAPLGRPLTVAERQQRSRARRAEDGVHHVNVALSPKAREKAEAWMARDAASMTAVINRLLERSRP